MRRTTVERSSNIRAVSHNKRQRRMRVWFKPKNPAQPQATVYDYWPVDADDVTLMLQATSIGRYFIEHFRNNRRVKYLRVR